MRAGQFPERVRFEQRGLDRNGDRLGDWVADPAFETAAGFTWLRGGETAINARLQGVQPVVVRVRISQLLATVTTAFRVVDLGTGDVFAIRSRILDRRARVLDFACDTGGTDG
ncbi:head-tail adaptor protein [Caulobacter zeae]|uniref:Head-tail adaptor protein n=1 Tax=Caulobacter zeae TaxID=2055137 RepID=A0A2N5DGA0_9CAUL|nr:head-tail adaptor protein [Caulobacter zeae]PLR25067.1 head-tail adaptor protein [Caulobacter zeae]